MVSDYIPESGDIIFIDINSTLAHEQCGYRPAVVISNNIFNKYTKMAMILLITTNTKLFPTHHIIKNSKKINGSVLCEQIKSVDYNDRKIKFVEKMNAEDFNKVQEIIKSCING